jgi:hypothetical protein
VLTQAALKTIMHLADRSFMSSPLTADRIMMRLQNWVKVNDFTAVNLNDFTGVKVNDSLWDRDITAVWGQRLFDRLNHCASAGTLAKPWTCRGKRLWWHEGGEHVRCVPTPVTVRRREDHVEEVHVANSMTTLRSIWL